MPIPKLPQYAPPTIPRRSVSSSEEPRKSGGFFNTLLLAVLIFWSIHLLTKKPVPPQISSSDEQNQAVDEVKPLETEALAKLSETLSEEVRTQAAQGSDEPKFVTLGSLDPNSPYRFLVTLSTFGGAVTRVEMNEDGFRDCSDSSGYLGQIVADETTAKSELDSGLPGVGVQTAGLGTPAANAGIRPGDRIVSIDLSQTSAEQGVVDVNSFSELREALLKTLPDETVTLGVLRKEKVSADEREPELVSVRLEEAPLQIIRPMGVIVNYDDYANMVGLQGVSRDLSNDIYDTRNEKEVYRRPNTDVSSFLLTLASYDKERLEWPRYLTGNRSETVGHNFAVDKELPYYRLEDGNLTPDTEDGLRGGNWEYVANESNETTAIFRKVLPARSLEIRKTYSISNNGAEGEKRAKKETDRDYHLTLTVTIRNMDPNSGHEVSYFLDGPTSLPVEGLWYSLGRKTGPGWGSYGMRDVVLKLGENSFHVLRCNEIALEKENLSRPSDPVEVDYIGVDSQYFEATMIPDQEEGKNLYEYLPIRVGARIAGEETFTNVSFRLKNVATTLSPSGQTGDSLSESYSVFIGPKRPATLKSYGLSETLVYGWFWFVSKPLAWILEFFRHHLVFNYGLAIILLTVLVRLCLFPLSIRMVASSIKMQKLQPQMNALKAQYKDDPQGMIRAQKELWKKNRVNPAGSCLPMFFQIPIFCGLYKVLNLDVNLYGAPLLSEKIRWCSNLAAPDMLFNWSHFWASHGWSKFNLGLGMFSLGPFLNLLPLLTVTLFLVQQKILMPPPTGGTPEELQQQKMMRFMMNLMMVFMGFMFFKVPCGLCVYFIASSLWGLLERRFLPKRDAAVAGLDGPIETAPAPISPAPSAKSEPRRPRRREPQAEPKKMTWREKWAEILEQAKEQQKLAKAEVEKRQKASLRGNPRNNGKKRR